MIAGARIATHHAEETALAEGTLVRLVALPVFALTAAATCLLARRLRKIGRTILPPLLFLEATLLAAFAGAAYHLHGSGSLGGAHALLISGSLGVAAMSVQNVLMREALPRLAPTTVMTGNFTQAVLDLIRLGDWRAPRPWQAVVASGMAGAFGFCGGVGGGRLRDLACGLQQACSGPPAWWVPWAVTRVSRSNE